MAGTGTREAHVLGALPSVDAVLRHPDVAALAGALDRAVVVDLVRDALGELRREARVGTLDDADSLAGLAVGRVLSAASQIKRPSLRRVINATGVVLHTNLGRAPLSEAARAAMIESTAGYSNLELDLES